MRTLDIIKTANGNLRKNKLRTFLTIIAVFIGSFTLTFTNAVGSGFQAYFDSLFSSVGFENNLFVTKNLSFDFTGTNIKEYDGSSKDQFGFSRLDLTDLAKIGSVEGVTEVRRDYSLAPEYVSNIKDSDKKYQLSLSSYQEGLEMKLSAGRLMKSEDFGVIITGPYSEALGFSSPEDAIGKEIQIALKNPFGELREFNVDVFGVRESALIEGGAIQISENAAKTLNSFQSAGISELEDSFLVVTASISSGASESQKNAVKAKLKELGYDAKTLEEQVGSVATIIDAFKIGLNAFGGIALLAASFGIVNTLFMAVRERTREIGLAKAPGMSRGTVFALFSIEAALIGFWGSVVGIGVAWGLGSWFNSVASEGILKDYPGLELAFNLPALISIVALIMLIAFLAGALPARRAARLNPIDALRYE